MKQILIKPKSYFNHNKQITVIPFPSKFSIPLILTETLNATLHHKSTEWVAYKWYEKSYNIINELEIETDDESWFEKFNHIRLIKNNKEEENIEIQIIE